MSINQDDYEQVSHIARLAVLALVARGVAGHEFESSPEIQAVRINISRAFEGEQAGVDIEFFGTSAIPLGGLAL